MQEAAVHSMLVLGWNTKEILLLFTSAGGEECCSGLCRAKTGKICPETHCVEGSSVCVVLKARALIFQGANRARQGGGCIVLCSIHKEVVPKRGTSGKACWAAGNPCCGFSSLCSSQEDLAGCGKMFLWTIPCSANICWKVRQLLRQVFWSRAGRQGMGQQQKSKQVHPPGQIYWCISRCCQIGWPKMKSPPGLQGGSFRLGSANGCSGSSLPCQHCNTYRRKSNILEVLWWCWGQRRTSIPTVCSGYQNVADSTSTGVSLQLLSMHIPETGNSSTFPFKNTDTWWSTGRTTSLLLSSWAFSAPLGCPLHGCDFTARGR